jgi:hypothetical protein
MEKVAHGACAGCGWEVPFDRLWIVMAAGIGAAGSLWAQDSGQLPQDLALAEARKESPVRILVNTSTLPRLESQDTGFQAPRVDVSLLPAGRSGLGVAVGMSNPRASAQPLGFTPRSSMDLGLHWRQMVHSKQIDVTAFRRMTPDEDAYTLIQQRQPVYGARVEMTLTAARKTGFSAESGFIGMQLESGAKISIKRRNGGPMMYYRSAF